MPKVPDAVRMFAPEQWGSVDYFSAFYEKTYNFDNVQKRATSGVSAHFRKATYLVNLAQKLKPNLDIDAAELEKNGYSPIHNSYELGTVIEAAILELYAVIDCTVKVMRAIHGKTCRGFKDSTSNFFSGIDKIIGTIPEDIRQAARDATWYNRLLKIRSEITHLMPGGCHLDHETKIVKYMHPGIKEDGRTLIIDDIFSWLNELMLQINRFIGVVFQSLSQNFKDEAVHQFCGMVQGRILHRYIKPAPLGEKISFDSGECGAWVWFEKPENPTCPFVDMCGAYNRKAPPEGWET